MAVDTTIVREAPFLEEARKKLLGSADVLTQTPITLPKQVLAGFSGASEQAFNLAQQGIGGYQPYLSQAAGQFGQAGQLLGGAAGQIPLAAGDLAQQQAQLGYAGQTFNPQTGQLQAAGGQLATGEGILGALGQRGSAGLDEARQAAFLGAGDITGRISAFQDPYQQQVIDSFQVEAARSAELARIRASQQAVQSGAFGGSRSGVESAELERNIADVTQRNIAGLLSQGYGQSLGAAEREAARRQQLPGQLMGIEQLQYQLPSGIAAQMQQAAAQRGQLAQGYGVQGQQMGQLAQGYGQLAAGRQGLLGSGAQLAGATQNLGGAYSGLAGLAQQLPAQDVALLSQVGSQQQQQAQRALDLSRQNILQQTYEPYQRVGYMSDILKGQPSVQSTLTQSTDPRGNPLSQILGAGISLAGIFGQGGFGTGYLFGNPSLAGRTQG